MTLAICAGAPDLEAPVDGRFGRCACFVLVDPESGEWEAVENPAATASGGAGAEATRFLAGRGVKAVVLGNVGPNAAAALEAMEVEIYTAHPGTARENLERYRQGDLSRVSGPTVDSHFGAQSGRRRGKRGDSSRN